MEKRTLIGLCGAITVHAAVAFGIAVAPRHIRSKPMSVEVDVRKKVPPKIAEPEKPPKPPEPPKPEPPKPKAKKPEVAKAPPPNQTPPPEPPKTPPKPVFGVTMDSTTNGDSAISVPVGNTTVADPNAARPKGPVQPLPPAPPQAQVAPVFQAASESEIDKYPAFEEGSCDAVYPDGEAKQSGIQGETILRVEIDEGGKVRGVRVIKKVGHGLDEVAVKLVRSRCKFTSAFNKAGKAIPVAITHHVTWTIE